MRRRNEGKADEMNAVRLVAIFAENKPGLLARVTRILADAGVNIRWVTIATSERFGVIKVLADQSERAFANLKDHGLAVSLLDVLAVEVEDQPGALHAVVDCLARRQINVENASGYVVQQRAVLLIEVKALAEAQQVLQEEGLRVLSPEEMLRL
jgi:hypothetical protein